MKQVQALLTEPLQNDFPLVAPALAKACCHLLALPALHCHSSSLFLLDQTCPFSNPQVCEESPTLIGTDFTNANSTVLTPSPQAQLRAFRLWWTTPSWATCA